MDRPWLILAVITCVAIATTLTTLAMTLIRELNSQKLAGPIRAVRKQDIRALLVLAGMFYAVAVVIVALA